MGVGGLLHGFPEGLERDLQAAVPVLSLGLPLPAYSEVSDGLHLYFYHLCVYLNSISLLEGGLFPQRSSQRRLRVL